MSRDNELDSLLQPLKEIRPSEMQMRRWAKRPTKSIASHVVQLSLAASIGFLVAMFLFKNPPEQKVAFDSSATIEIVYNR